MKTVSKKISRKENWFEELPVEIKSSVRRGLKQAEEGKVISHDKVMKKYRMQK